MAELHELIAKIENPELRAQIAEAAKRALKHKQFGLVFEEHLPECTPLFDIPIRKGVKVSVRNGKANETYTVLKIVDGIATCLPKNSKEAVEFAVNDLVTTAELGDPIYPCLQPLGEVCNAPDSDLWHTLIEADNYHALQLLEYLYAGKVDCIYIDPPYNTGAKDWKYNNDYVDGTDEYRHSKWLSFMQKRLEIAKRLLNPNDSVLIVTIDEKEYLHLGCLLEEMFKDAKIQMISDVINPRGTTRDGSFSRTDEYIFVVQMGINRVFYPAKGEKHYVEWYRLRRTDHESRRGTVKGGTQQFYPIYIDESTESIVHVGEPLSVDQDKNDVPKIGGAVAVFPVKNDGTEMNWAVTPDTLKTLMDYHFVRVRKNAKGNDFHKELDSLGVRLTMNHRSAPRLVTLQKAMYNSLKEKATEVSVSDRWAEDDGEIALFVADDEQLEAYAISEDILAKILAGTKPSDICILCKQVPQNYAPAIIAELEKHGVRARIENEYQDLIKEPIIDLLIKFMLCANNRKHPNEWNFIEESLVELWGIGETQRNDAYDEMQRKLVALADRVKKTVQQGFDGVLWHDTLKSIINFFNIERIKAKFPAYKQGTYFDDLISKFENLFFDEYVAVCGNWDRAIENFCGEHSIPIMTIHKSKGLEYTAVYFVGLEDSAFWNFRNQPNEDRCTFFVALSRAKESVTFTFCKRRTAIRNPMQQHKEINEFFDLLQRPEVAEVKTISRNPAPLV